MGKGIQVVTGGAGFIGSHLIRALREQGRPVRVVDDLSSGSRSNLPEGISFIEGDVTRLAREAVAGAEVIYHLAAMVSVPRSVAEPLESHRATAESTLALLVAAEREGVRRVVNISSSAVYGDAPGLPKREDQAPRPMSPYAVAKLCGEEYARYWAASRGLETVSLRFFNVFGPRQDPDSPYSAAIPIFLRRLEAGQPVTIFGDGRQTRDFTYVEDVVRGIMAAGESPAASGNVYNIAAGRPLSVLELLDTLGAVAGASAPREFRPPRAGDIRDSWADISAARRDLGFEPRTTLEEGLRATIDWHRREDREKRRQEQAPRVA